MNEAVAQAFSGGSRAPPGANEGNNIVRTVTNELDSARFDPLLVRAVAKNAATSLESMATKVDGLVRGLPFVRMSLMAFIAGCERPFGCVALGPNGHSTTIAKWTGCELSISLLDQVGETEGRTHGECVYRHWAQHNRA
jgi:hypothetical protein